MRDELGNEIPIGPNACHSCGGEYGEHRADCQYAAKRGRVEPEEVSMLVFFLENQKLRGDIAELKRRVADLEAAGVRSWWARLLTCA